MTARSDSFYKKLLEDFATEYTSLAWTERGLFMLPFAPVAGPQHRVSRIISDEWPILLFTGLILLGAGKIVRYGALCRLDISKAISLGMTFPFFSLIVLIAIFGVSVSSHQWIGIAVMMGGVSFPVRRTSVDPSASGYTPY